MSSSGVSQISAENQAEWGQIQATSVDEQANTFLKAFVGSERFGDEFSGSKFEQVLDIASEFKKFLTKGANELEEHQAHLFLEKRGETLTAARLRELLKEIDVDNNHMVSFVEYALFKWQKSVKDFFIELHTPKKGSSEELEKAIAAYRAVLAVREAREAKMAELEKVAAAGGVKGMAAKNELEQMKAADQLEMNRNEITAGAKKRAAEKNAVADPFEEEQKRLAKEKAEREAEEERKRQESRAKLAARAAAFGGAK